MVTILTDCINTLHFLHTVYLRVPSDTHININNITEKNYPVILHNADGLCSLSQEMNTHTAFTWHSHLCQSEGSPRRPGFQPRQVYEWFIVDSGTVTSFLPALRFPLSVSFHQCSTHIHSPTIIPPMFHTHSFTNHPQYIMFLSQYFSFPLSVSFHQCSIPFIHLPSFHQCSILIHSSTIHNI